MVLQVMQKHGKLFQFRQYYDCKHRKNDPEYGPALTACGVIGECRQKLQDAAIPEISQ